jgi:putative Holliday junction resolvase
VASGTTLTRSAAPLEVVANGPAGPDWAAIDRLIAAYRPAVLVVGYPYNEDGTPGSMAAAADAFAAGLAHRAALPVERVDEHGSSREADATLKAMRGSGQRRRRLVRGDSDGAAAALILERWLQQPKP